MRTTLPFLCSKKRERKRGEAETCSIREAVIFHFLGSRKESMKWALRCDLQRLACQATPLGALETKLCHKMENACLQAALVQVWGWVLKSWLTDISQEGSFKHLCCKQWETEDGLSTGCLLFCWCRESFAGRNDTLNKFGDEEAFLGCSCTKPVSFPSGNSSWMQTSVLVCQKLLCLAKTVPKGEERKSFPNGKVVTVKERNGWQVVKPHGYPRHSWSSVHLTKDNQKKIQRKMSKPLPVLSSLSFEYIRGITYESPSGLACRDLVPAPQCPSLVSLSVKWG